MPDVGLKIRIGADLQGAIAHVNALTSSVSSLGAAVKNPISLRPLDTAALSASIKKLKLDILEAKFPLDSFSKSASASIAGIAPAVNTATASLSKMVPGANQANQALLNLGRVAQDSPFGFIGISNNINPLLESFQRLKAETGTTGGALKALGSSLKGGSGIGLAVSVITAAVTLASIGFDRWVPKIKDAKKETKELEESSDGIVKSLAEESSRISILVGAIQQDVLSKKQRNGAVDELKRLNPDYFGQLDSEKSKVEQVTLAYINYANSLKEQFKTKALSKQLDALSDKKLKLEVELDPKTAAVNDPELSKRINELQNKINRLGGISILPKGLSADITQLTEPQQKVLDLQRQILSLNSIQVIDPKATADLKDTNKQIDGLLARITKSGNLDIKLPGGTKKEVDPLVEAIKNLETYQKEVGLTSSEFQKLINLRVQLVSRDQIKLGLDGSQLAKEIVSIRNSNELLDVRKKKLDDLAKTVELLASEKTEGLNIDVKIALNDLATGKLDLNQVQRTIDAAAKAADLRIPASLSIAQDVQAELKAKGLELPIITIPFKVNTEDLGVKDAVSKINAELALAGVKPTKLNVDTAPADAALSALNKSINTTVQHLATEAFSTVGEAIGTALAGGDVQEVFGNFIKILADGLKEIGKAMISFGTARLILANIAKLNPGIAIVAGVALVAAGAALQTSINKRKFSEGAIVTGPTSATIGEAGPEVVFPLTDLNSTMRKIMGGQSGNGIFIPNVTIKGSDLVLAFNREKTRSGGSFSF